MKIKPSAFGIGLFGLLVLISMSCEGGSADPRDRRATDEIGKTVSDSGLRDAILAEDWTATLTAREAGPSAAGTIADLVKHEERGVRLLAVACLEEMGGDEAATTLVGALGDGDQQVRESAVRALHTHPSEAVVGALFNVLVTSNDPYVLQQVPMILGRNPSESVDGERLVELWKKQADPSVQEGFIVGLARLGNRDARDAFVDGLRSSAGDRRDRYLTHCEYIHQEWLLKPLGELLADTTELRYIGPHEFEVNLRACDIAVNLIASISGHGFAFAVNGRTNYEAAQLDEVRRYVGGLPG